MSFINPVTNDGPALGVNRLHNPEAEMDKDEALKRAILIIETSCDVGPITAQRVAEEILDIIWPQTVDALRPTSSGRPESSRREDEISR
jgi:hypothetical protein